MRMQARQLVSIVLLFLVIAYKTSIKVAAIFILCGLIGYANEFFVLRSIISLFKGEKVVASSAAISMLAVAGSGIAIYYGFGVLVGFTTFCFFAIDAVALRFK